MSASRDLDSAAAVQSQTGKNASCEQLPRHIPMVCPFFSKNSKNCFLASGALHLILGSAILARELQKLRNPEIAVVVVAGFQNRVLVSNL